MILDRILDRTAQASAGVVAGARLLVRTAQATEQDCTGYWTGLHRILDRILDRTAPDTGQGCTGYWSGLHRLLDRTAQATGQG